MSDNVVLQRELWLSEAVTKLRPFMAQRGLQLPERVAVEVGVTMTCEDGRPALGQCSPRWKSEEGIPRILLSQELSNPLRLLDVLLHELLHAADDCENGHGAWFQAWARHFGLQGNPGTWAGPRLKATLLPIARALGPYPSASKRFVINSEGRLVA